MHTSSRRTPRIQSSFSWTWIIAVGVIAGLLILKWMFGGDSSKSNKTDYLLVTPTGTGSSVYISMSEGSKNQINSAEKLYTSDKSVFVDVGSAQGTNDFLNIDMDSHTELSYISTSPNGTILSLSKGRSWIHAIQIPTIIRLKNFSLEIQPGNIVLVEQNNAYSIAYAIQGTVALNSTIGTYSLAPGNRIMIGASDIAGNSPLSGLAGSIDESIMQNILFQRNNGSNYLNQINIQNSQGSGSVLTSSGNSLTGIISEGNHFIEIINPIDGTMIKTSTVNVMGKVLSKEVKRVTINDKDASISPVNETFTLQDIAIDKDIINLVYKAYDTNSRLLEKGVITIFGAKGAKNAQGASLVSNNFPLSNKDFKISFPTENPYKTTESLVKVQGTVPKDTVAYIVVNDYRLQKFMPNSTIWYYYANMDTKSMVDGINLYTIKFYASDDTILYSQLFTIVKESKNASISGEFIR